MTTRLLVVAPMSAALTLLAGCGGSETVGLEEGGEAAQLEAMALRAGPARVPLYVDYVVVNGRIFLPPDDPDYPPQCREIDGWDEGFIVGNNNDDHGVFWFGGKGPRGKGFEFVSLSSTDCVDVRDLTLHNGRAVLSFPGLNESQLTLLYSGRVTGGEPGAFTFEATGTLGEGTRVFKCAQGELNFTGQQNGDGSSSYVASGFIRLACGKR